MPRKDQELAGVAAQSAWLRRLAIAVARDSHAGEDISQDALLAAIEARPAVIEDLRSWLRGIVRNLIRRHLRDEDHRKLREERAARRGSSEDSALAFERFEIQEALLGAVRDLKEPYRTTVVLRWFEELGPREIAKRTGVPLRTVHTRISRALSLLRHELDRRSHGDRSRWMSAWVSLVPTTALPRPWMMIMDLKVKLAIAGACVAAGFVMWRVWPPRADAGLTTMNRVKDSESTQPASPTNALSVDGSPAASGERAAAAAQVAESKDVVRGASHVVPGMVVDASGAPLDGVEVIFATSNSADPANGARATSDARGRFRIDVGSGEGVLRPRGESWVTIYEPQTRLPDPPEDYVLVVAPRRSLSGRVIDTDGLPISGAEIRINPAEDSGNEDWMANQDPEVSRFTMEGPGFEPLRAKLGLTLDRSVAGRWRTSSNPDGTFRLEGAPLVPEFRVVTAKRGYARDKHAVPADGAEMTIVLKKGRPHLRGRVVDPTGAAVSGARIVLGTWVATSSSKGQFEFELAEQQKGTRLIAVKAGWTPAVQRCLADSPNAAEAWPKPLVLTLKEATLTIVGRVVDRAGQPVAGMQVRALDPVRLAEILALAGEEPAQGRQDEGDWLGEDTSTTDANGRFRVSGLLPRAYHLLAVDPNSLVVATSGPIDAGEQEALITVTEDTHPAGYAGRVLDPRGKPVASARVRLRRSVPRPGFETAEPIMTEPVLTDRDGRFSIDNVARGADAVIVQVEDQAGSKSYSIDSSQDPRSLIVTAGLIGHLVVEVRNTEAKIDAVELLDPRGVPMEIAGRRGGGLVSDTHWSYLVNGRTEPLVVSEEAVTLVLYGDSKEVMRVPIQVRPGETVTVRP